MDQNMPKFDMNHSNLKGTLQIAVYQIKEKKLLSQIYLSILLYVVPVMNYEGLNLAHF